MMDYKASKEAYVSGMTGSSIGHINMISLVSLVSDLVITFAPIQRRPV